MIRMSLFCVGAFLRMHGSNVKYPQFWGWIEGRWKFLKIGLSEAFGIAFLLAFQHSPPLAICLSFYRDCRALLQPGGVYPCGFGGHLIDEAHFFGTAFRGRGGS